MLGKPWWTHKHQKTENVRRYKNTWRRKYVKEVLVLGFFLKRKLSSLDEVCRAQSSAENPETCCMMWLHYPADLLWEMIWDPDRKSLGGRDWTQRGGDGDGEAGCHQNEGSVIMWVRAIFPSPEEAHTHTLYSTKTTMARSLCRWSLWSYLSSYQKFTEKIKHLQLTRLYMQLEPAAS